MKALYVRAVNMGIVRRVMMVDYRIETIATKVTMMWMEMRYKGVKGYAQGMEALLTVSLDVVEARPFASNSAEDIRLFS